MRVAFMMAVVALLPGLYTPAPQGSEEEAIKAVLRAQVKAFRARNADAWQALWVHDANVTRTLVANGAVLVAYRLGQGVSPNHPGNERGPDAHCRWNPTWRTSSSAEMANVAWVFWDQHSTASQDPTAKNASREHRVLLKDGGQWKIASQDYTRRPAASRGPNPAENSINGAGYALLGGQETTGSNRGV